MWIAEKLCRPFILLAAVLSVNAGAQNSPSGSTTFEPAKPLPGVVPTAPMMQMPLAIPLFLVGNQFASTLILVNDSTATTYADVTLRGVDGQVLVSKRVNFTANSQRRLDLASLFGRTSSATTAGSVLIMQSPQLMGPSIAATLAMTFQGSADPNYIDEEVFMPSEMGSHVLQGVSDPSDGSTLLAISSLTSMTQRVKIDCLRKHQAVVTRQVELMAGQTLLTDACRTNTKNDDDVDALLDKRTDERFGATGFRLTSDAMPGSFAAFALSPHQKSGDTFFSNVLFADPKLVNSPDTVFTGVPAGTSTLLPGGAYTTHLSLTNFSNNPVHIRVTFAETSRDKPEARDVGSVTLAPESSEELRLTGLDGDPDLQNSFIVHSDGAPGAVAVKFVSRSDSRLHEVELQAKDAKDPANAGGHPWSTEDQTDSTLLLFNHGDKPQVFTVSISGSESWQTDYTLAPMQTKAISVRRIVENATKDGHGRMLSKEVRNGQISWMVPDSTTVSGRVLQTDSSGAMARSFSCGYSGLLCGSTFKLITTFFLDDGSTADFGTLTAVTCTSGTQNSCSGQPTGTGGSFNFNWTSSTPSVAAISGTSQYSTVSLRGMSPGSSGIRGMITSNYCQSGGGGGATVQVPDHLSVQSDVPSTINCNSAGYSKVRAVTYNVLDPTQAQILRPIAVFETTNPSIANSCNQLPVPTSYSCTTTPRPGNFTDTLSAGCPTSAQVAAQGCGFTVPDQTWEWCGPSFVPLADIGSLIVDNNYISIGGNSSGFSTGMTFPK